ncbi:MAG: ASCH domain-containing protein [Pseudomonadota bacterium]
MSVVESALISIKPKYADAIISGAKTVELRRRIPPLKTGTCLWIYATRPRGAVIGTAIVSGIIKGTPEQIWEACNNDAAVDRCTFDAYFDSSAEAFGIILSEIARREPISFEKLKEIRSNFHPPQVLMRLTAQEALFLHNETTAA